MAHMRSGVAQEIDPEDADVPRQRAPAEFLDLARAEMAALGEWAGLFDAAGWPDGLSRDAFDHSDVVTAFARSLLPDPLLDALQCGADLGTPEGVEELLTVAAARGYSSAALGSHTNPLTFVFDLWRRHHQDRRLAIVLRLAQLALRKRAGPTKAFREFVGAEARPYPGGSAVADRIQNGLMQVIVAARMGPVLDLLIDDSGRTVTHVFMYAGREQEHLVATIRGREPQRLRFVVCDVLQYDTRDGRLTISTRSRGLIPAYRREMGLALFDDPAFFAGDDLWSLDVLQRDGAKRLFDHGMLGEIAEVAPRRVAWRPDDDNRVVFDGERCFDLLGAHGWREGGRLLELDIELRFWGAGASRARVGIKVPNRVEVRPERYRAAVDRYLEASGIRTSMGRSLGLWAVAEGVHDDDELAKGMGATFERLKESGLVRPANRWSRIDSERGIHEEIEVVQLPMGVAVVAVSNDEVYPPEIITADDARGSRVEMSALTGHIARELGLSGAPHLAAPGLHDLGTRTINDQRVRVFLVASKPRDLAETHTAIENRRHDGSRPVLLVPAGHRALDGLLHIEWGVWCPPFDVIWPRIVKGLGLQGDDPWADAEPGMELLIHEGEQRIRFDGVDIALHGDQEFYFVLAVAKQKRGKYLTTQKLAASFTQNPSATPQAAYMAKKRVLQAIDASLRVASRIFPKAKRDRLFERRVAAGGGFEIRLPFQILGRQRQP